MDSTVTFSIYKEIIKDGEDTPKYTLVNDLPPMYVTRLTMTHALDKTVEPVPPTPGSTEDNPPVIHPAGVKTKTINVSGTFQGCAYVMGESPPVNLIPQGSVLYLDPLKDIGTFCPEFCDDQSYWRVVSVDWNVDTKSLLWAADIATTYIWLNAEESMFFV